MDPSAVSYTLRITTALLLLSAVGAAKGQIDEDQLGGWYMYFFSGSFNDSRWGFQGDIQYRNWDVTNDLEQLLLRGGVTYKATDNALITLGYANIGSGQFGPGSNKRHEDRIYQEALLRQKLGSRLFLRHRFRFEQRWVENQDFRTRFRYGLFVDIPLGAEPTLGAGSTYLALYNEIFLNTEKNIGDGRRVEVFDRNRLYAALGYSLRDSLKLQAGYMHQFTDGLDKGQLQLSIHQSFNRPQNSCFLAMPGINHDGLRADNRYRSPGPPASTSRQAC